MIIYVSHTILPNFINSKIFHDALFTNNKNSTLERHWYVFKIYIDLNWAYE